MLSMKKQLMQVNSISNESERKQAEGRHFASNNTNLEFIFIQETLSYQEDKSMDDIPPMAILEKTAKTADDGKY